MKKQNLTIIKNALCNTCKIANVPYEIIVNEDNNFSILVLKEHKSKSQGFHRSLKEAAILSRCFYNVSRADNGVAFILSTKPITEDVLSAVVLECNLKYNHFYAKLSSTIGTISEDQFKSPTTALSRSSTAEQFDASFTPQVLKYKSKKKKKTIDDKLNEAFEGIATPNDIQPQEALAALVGALKDSGLAADLKKAGVTWHIAEPGKHLITFSKNDVPVLQRSTLELAEPNVLGEVLSALRSIADGKAPEAGQIELDMMQKKAKDAREKQTQLTDIAAQYTSQFNPEAVKP